MLGDPDRGAIKRKWAVDKTNGPTVHFAEQVQKKLIAHYWPCSYEYFPNSETIVFRPIKGRRFSGSFQEQLALAIRIISAPTGVRVKHVGMAFRLIGPHEITKQGKVRPCKEN